MPATLYAIYSWRSIECQRHVSVLGVRGHDRAVPLNARHIWLTVRSIYRSIYRSLPTIDLPFDAKLGALPCHRSTDHRELRFLPRAAAGSSALRSSPLYFSLSGCLLFAGLTLAVAENPAAPYWVSVSDPCPSLFLCGTVPFGSSGRTWSVLAIKQRRGKRKKMSRFDMFMCSVNMG